MIFSFYMLIAACQPPHQLVSQDVSSTLYTAVLTMKTVARLLTEVVVYLLNLESLELESIQYCTCLLGANIRKAPSLVRQGHAKHLD